MYFGGIMVGGGRGSVLEVHQGIARTAGKKQAAHLLRAMKH